LGEFSPYWANFPLIGRIFPLLGEFSPYWAIVYLSSIFWATCIHGTSYGRIRFDKKKYFGRHFGRLFQKLARPPCSDERESWCCLNSSAKARSSSVSGLLTTKKEEDSLFLSDSLAATFHPTPLPSAAPSRPFQDPLRQVSKN
jgi:hypothetical protein